MHITRKFRPFPGRGVLKAQSKFLFVRERSVFYFVCPAGLIQPDELPVEVGLIWYNPEKDSLYTKRKALHRPIEISAEMLMYIVMAKMDSDRHPFFSDKREFFEAMREDKKDRKELGYYVARETRELIESLRANKRRIERLETDSEALQDIRNVLKKHGINTYRDMAEALDKALSTGIPPEILSKVNRMGELATEIDKIIQVKKAVNE